MRPVERIEEKRFAAISKEDPTQKVARERLDALKGLYRDLKQQRPEIISFGLFGSYSKGLATARSDIDMSIFIDDEKAETNYGWGLPPEDLWELEQRWIDFHRGRSGINFTSNDKKIRDHVKEEYFRDLIKDGLMERANISYELTSGLDVILLSKKEVDAELGFWGDQLECQRPITGAWQSCIVTMFYLAIGNDIKPYGRYLLEKLQDMGTRGENIWKGIVQNLQDIERTCDRKHTSQKGLPVKVGMYPQTIEEALKRFTYSEASAKEEGS